jgi:glycosyltransferase involved in cell wall biosynthesis
MDGTDTLSATTGTQRADGRSPIHALILARHKAHQGGVVSFVELLLENYSEDVRASRFVIGRSPDKTSRVGALLAIVQDAFRLAREVRKTKYDIIHINPSLNFNAMARDGLFMCVLLAGGSPNLVVFLHGWDPAFYFAVKRYALTRYLCVRLLRSAGGILVLANQFKEQLREIGLDHRRIMVLTTMFDRRLFDNVQRRRSDTNTRLLFLSRLIKEKGVHEVLAAYLLLMQRVPDLELVVAGDGPERPMVERWIRDHKLGDRVKSVGYVRGCDKAQVLLDADIFVFPTYYGEGCPISLLEAMAAGLAIITTPVGGIPDFFVDGENGILLHSTTPSCIADAIENLIADPQRLLSIRAHNREQAWRQYEARQVTRTVEDFYATVLLQEESTR